MKQSESIKSLFESLVKAQAEFTTMPKDKAGYNYMYTDLDTVISTVRPVLARNNLGFLQSLTILENGQSAITTRLFTSTGEWIEDTTPLPNVSLSKGNAAQNLGAAITYMKRYTLCAILGISSDEDTDAVCTQNAPAETKPIKKTQGQPIAKAPALAGGPDTPEQRKRITELLATRDKSGNEIFVAEKGLVGGWRKERTAEEVIRYLEEEKAKRMPLSENFPDDIPFEPTPQEKQQLDAIW